MQAVKQKLQKNTEPAAAKNKTLSTRMYMTMVLQNRGKEIVMEIESWWITAMMIMIRDEKQVRCSLDDASRVEAVVLEEVLRAPTVGETIRDANTLKLRSEAVFCDGLGHRRTETPAGEMILGHQNMRRACECFDDGRVNEGLDGRHVEVPNGDACALLQVLGGLDGALDHCAFTEDQQVGTIALVSSQWLRVG